MMNKVKKPRLAVIAAAPLLMAAIPVVAHADSMDDNYIKVLTANGITGARADLIDDAHQICAKIRAGENSVALTSWVMSETGFSGFAQASLHHLLKRATEGFLPTAGLFARLRRFWSVYGRIFRSTQLSSASGSGHGKR
jgi:hypothetical protein